MSTHRSPHSVSRPVDARVPTDREYDTAAAAELDRRLCEAIDAAETVGDEYLASLLAMELGSHYFDTR